MIAVTASMSPSSAGEGGGVGGGSGDGGGGGDGGGDGDAHVGGDDDDDGGEFAFHALGGPCVLPDGCVNAFDHAVAPLNIYHDADAVVRAPSSHPVTSALKLVALENMDAMVVTAAVFQSEML